LVDRTIAHVDMDAFFASVELLRRPELRGKPVVVANDRSRAVVAAASYTARRYGVRSAMPLVTAKRLCPELVTVPGDMDHYREVSAQVMEILGHYSDRVEVAGLDEAYLDLSPSPAPRTRARALKNEVKQRTGLTCSIGLAPNKLIAKIASDLDKPDGFCQLSQEEFLPRIGDRPARLIPGVGPKTAERLSAAGIETVFELATASDELLARALGPNGPALALRAQGRDDRDIEVERERKSESREVTFPSDVTSRDELERVLERLAGRVANSLAGKAIAGRTITLKLRLAPFRTFTRSRTLPRPTNEAAAIAGTAKELLRAFDPADPVRLIGVGVSSLAPVGADAKEPPGGPVQARLPI
jgi:DNA polymerase-4